MRLWLSYNGYNPSANTRHSGEDWLVSYLSSRWGNKPALVIDCGANRGDYTRLVLEKTQFKVIAIEPSPTRVEELNRLQDQYPQRMQVIACGVGCASEIKDFIEIGDDDFGSTFAPEVLEIDYLAMQFRGKTRCQIRLLDDIVDEVTKDTSWELPIVLIKIDVEGLEDDVFKGAKRMLETNPPFAIQFEGNWHQLFRETTVRSVASLARNFDLYQLLPGRRGIKRREPASWSTNVYAHANWVLLASEE